MITPRIKPSGFFEKQAGTGLFVQEHRRSEPGSYAANLAAMDGLIDFRAVAGAVDTARPRADRSKGGRPPYPTEIMVRMVFLQSLYNLSDEGCEHQVLGRMSFERFCRLDGVLHIPDARMLWCSKRRLVEDGLDGRAIFDAVSQQLQPHGYLPPCGGQIVAASIVQAPITQARSEQRQALNYGKALEG